MRTLIEEHKHIQIRMNIVVMPQIRFIRMHLNIEMPIALQILRQLVQHNFLNVPMIRKR
ncbi:hypothetical protein D3C76_1473330 [compost metagenome]